MWTYIIITAERFTTDQPPFLIVIHPGYFYTLLAIYRD